MRKILVDMYIDWVNNFVSIDTFAEHHGLHKNEAIRLITLAREVFQTEHPDA